MHVQQLPHLGDDCVVDDAALLVGEAAEGPGAVLQARNVSHNEALDESDGVLTLLAECCMLRSAFWNTAALAPTHHGPAWRRNALRRQLTLREMPHMWLTSKSAARFLHCSVESIMLSLY